MIFRECPISALHYEMLHAPAIMQTFCVLGVLPNAGGTNDQDPFELAACLAIAEVMPRGF